jgi:hypothetical protein
MKIMYTLKGLGILYIAILVELVKNHTNQILTGITLLLIIALTIDKLVIFIILMCLPLAIFLIMAIIIYRSAMSDPSDKALFDSKVEKVLDTLSELAYFK